MISLGVLALLEHPDQLPRLYAGPAELANAVEELLRWVTIAHTGLTRTTLEDITLGDVTIPAGEAVIRMRWARAMAREAFAESAPAPWRERTGSLAGGEG
jgi:cytochrome P450